VLLCLRGAVRRGNPLLRKAAKTISEGLFEVLDKFTEIAMDEVKSISLHYARDVN